MLPLAIKSKEPIRLDHQQYARYGCFEKLDQSDKPVFIGKFLSLLVQREFVLLFGEMALVDALNQPKFAS